MREASSDAIDLIVNFEGLSLEPYKDSAGLWTIGYGHMTEERHEPITQAQAEAYLVEDVKIASKAVDRYVNVPLDQWEFDALTCFVFNIGQGNFRNSTLLKLLNEGKYAAVPNQLRLWVYAGGKKLRGLVRRREAEAYLFYFGDEGHTNYG